VLQQGDEDFFSSSSPQQLSVLSQFFELFASAIDG
jgi:hypothetical protein